MLRDCAGKDRRTMNNVFERLKILSREMAFLRS
jgi:hypothetical protein